MEMQAEEGMARGLLEAFSGLGKKLNLLNALLSTLECAQLIKPYEGGPKQFKDWIKSIENLS